MQTVRGRHERGGHEEAQRIVGRGHRIQETSSIVFNSRMSFVSEAWIKADPNFWKQKVAPASGAAPKKAADKPAVIH